MLAVVFPGAVSQALRQIGLRAGQRITRNLIRKYVTENFLKDATRFAAKYLFIRVTTQRGREQDRAARRRRASGPRGTGWRSRPSASGAIRYYQRRSISPTGKEAPPVTKVSVRQLIRRLPWRREQPQLPPPPPLVTDRRTHTRFHDASTEHRGLLGPREPRGSDGFHRELDSRAASGVVHASCLCGSVAPVRPACFRPGAPYPFATFPGEINANVCPRRADEARRGLDHPRRQRQGQRDEEGGRRRRRLRRRRARLRHARVHQGRRQGGPRQGPDEVHADALLPRAASQAIADKFNRENGLPYKPEQITTGAGGKHCLYMAFMAVLNPGDEVLIPSPYWVSYPEQVKLAGGVPKIVRGEETNGFKITPQQLEQAITPEDEGLHHQLARATPPATRTRRRS